MKKWFTNGVLRIILSFAKEYWTEGLIPWRGVMLQKLAVPQTAKILPSFMEPEIPLPHYHYPTLSQINPQFCHHVSLRPYIILPSKSRSSKWSLSVRSTNETLYEPLLSHILSTCSAPLVWAGIA
jgi:hypothetical protein